MRALGVGQEEKEEDDGKGWKGRKKTQSISLFVRETTQRQK